VLPDDVGIFILGFSCGNAYGASGSHENLLFMLKTYSFRLYPNHAQTKNLAQHFGAARWIYNQSLERKIKVYQETKKSLSWVDLAKEITGLKKAAGTMWFQDVALAPLQSSVRHLDSAFKRFFQEKRGFPAFKRRRGRQSFQYPTGVKVDFPKHLLYLPRIGWIRFRDPRVFYGKIGTVTVVKSSTGKHYAQVLVELPGEVIEKKPLEQSRAVGVDVGLTTFATFSDGRKIANPRFLKTALTKLRRANRRLSRKQKGSNNRSKSRLKLAHVHEKIANRRKDFLHKLTSQMTNENQVDTWVVETLNVKGMGKMRSLSRAIHDAAWSEFVRQLAYKSEWRGKNLVKIGRFMPSSKMCSCGAINDSLRLADRTWTCAMCGATHDRDVLAAQNILRFGFDTEGNPGINASGQAVP
jgi:putative transposase